MWKAQEKNYIWYIWLFCRAHCKSSFSLWTLLFLPKILKKIKGKNVKSTRKELWYIWLFCRTHCKRSFSLWISLFLPKILKRIKGKNVKSRRKELWYIWLFCRAHCKRSLPLPSGNLSSRAAARRWNCFHDGNHQDNHQGDKAW